MKNYVSLDPPDKPTNGDMVGDVGREIYNPHADDVDSDHDVENPNTWDGDVDSL